MIKENIKMQEPKKVETVEEFCRLRNELQYMGTIVNKKTNKVIKNAQPIVKIDDAYYTCNLVYMYIDGCTYLDLWIYKGFNPDMYIWTKDCTVLIEEKEIFKGKNSLYAYLEEDMEKAKKIVRHMLKEGIYHKISYKGKSVPSQEFLAI